MSTPRGPIWIGSAAETGRMKRNRDVHGKIVAELRLRNGTDDLLFRVTLLERDEARDAGDAVA